MHTQLNKIITGVQFITEKVEEWNLMTARAFTLKKELEPILYLLLDWRKLERRSWKFMLNDKER